MDGAVTMSEIVETFRTPVRILLPKLLKSRDDWKAKSHQRKAKLRSASTKIRDLSASRDKWRQRTERLEEDNRQLQERLERAEREGEQARVALTALEEVKKK
jgi:chromosome segregation ATPase